MVEIFRQPIKDFGGIDMKDFRKLGLSKSAETRQVPNKRSSGKRSFDLKGLFSFFNPKALRKKYVGLAIYKKLSISFLVVVLISNVIIGLVGIINLSKADKMSTQIYNEDIVTLEPLYRIEAHFLTLVSKINDNDIYQNMSDISTLSTQINNDLRDYRSTIKDKQEQETIRKMAEDVTNLNILSRNAFNYFIIGDSEAAYKHINGDIAKATEDFDKLINGLFDKKIAEAKQRNEQNQRNFTVSLIIMAVITVASITLSAILGRINAKIISKPINALVKSANAIAEGNLETDIEKGNGDEITILAESFEKIVASLKLLREDVDNLIGGAVEGKLSVRADESRQSGAYRGIISGVNKLLDAITVPLNTAAEYIDSIGRGDIPQKITEDFKGDFNRIKISLNNCIDSVNALIEDAEMLSDAAVAGNLSVRADASRHNGDFGKVIEGVNNTLDAIVEPLETSAAYLDRISRGDIPDAINDEFKGDFNHIKASLNRCIVSVKALIEDAQMLSEAAVAGQLSVRADASRHNGDFAKVIEGVNNALDAVIKPLRIAGDYVERISRGDIPQRITDKQNGEYENFNNSINTCIDAINLLIADANMLSDAAARGDLSVRADVTKHQGDFRKIIEGQNNTFKAMAEPLSEAVTVLAQLANGNLSVKAVGEYKGDLAIIKESINSMAAAWSGYINEISSVLAEMAQGNLDVEITSEFKGDLVAIKDSINNIIETFNKVISEIIIAAEQITVSSKQVSEGSQNLSAGASEQAASVEELNASIAEIAQKTRENAASAAKADQIANAVKEDAISGTEKMSEMLDSMSKISEAASSISKVIKVIDDIAFQTNILALNAAVEAARAGQYGRGFAVVADEVRNLATKSANAAKETTQMIDTSIAKSAEGTNIANDTSGALKKIEDGVLNTAALIAEIAKSSNEQANGIAQINKSVEQVSRIVQTNSATAEESAAACEELFGQAENMKTLVSRFKVKAKNKD